MSTNRWFTRFVLWIFVLAIFLTTPQPISAQGSGWKFQSVSVGSGENAISSGITGILGLVSNDGSQRAEIAVQHEQAWFDYGLQFGKSAKFLVAGSVGHYQGSPWAGPLLTLSVPLAEVGGQQVTLSAIQWPAFFAKLPSSRDNGKPYPEPLIIGYYGGVGLDIGPLGLVYSLQNFMDNPWNQLPGASYTVTIRKDFSVLGSATWNNNGNRMMYFIGGTWKP